MWTAYKLICSFFSTIPMIVIYVLIVKTSINNTERQASCCQDNIILHWDFFNTTPVLIALLQFHECSLVAIGEAYQSFHLAYVKLFTVHQFTMSISVPVLPVCFRSFVKLSELSPTYASLRSEGILLRVK